MIDRWKKYLQNLKKIERENALLKKNLSLLIRDKYPQLINPDSRSGINQHEFNVYSQNGEDGILLYILSQIGAVNHRIIEFGGSDGIQCNSANLILNFNWKALLIEGNGEKVKAGIKYYSENNVDSERMKFISSFINAENINGIFTANGFSGEIDILSVDIDGNDYHVWKAINTVNPRIVVCEYNAAFGPNEKMTIPYDPSFTLKSKESSGFYFGASLALLEKLGEEKGFALLGTDLLGVNAFFVRRDLLNDHLIPVNASKCYRENLKCKKAGGYTKAFEKIRHLEYYRP